MVSVSTPSTGIANCWLSNRVVPLGTGQVTPPAPTHVHETFERSEVTTPTYSVVVVGSGPKFVTVAVNVTVSPTLATAGAPVMVTAMSASAAAGEAAKPIIAAAITAISSTRDARRIGRLL